jgi:hypothetical protein
MPLESPLCFSIRLRLTCLIGGANLRRQIVERFLPALTLKTMVAGFTFQLPFKSYPQKERADARALAEPRADEAIALLDSFLCTNFLYDPYLLPCIIGGW